MPCLFALAGFFAPRLVLALCFFSGFIGRAYHSFWVPCLGFFFMPLTTLAYAAAINWYHDLSGGAFFAVLIAALFDMGVIGGGVRTRYMASSFTRTTRM